MELFIQENHTLPVRLPVKKRVVRVGVFVLETSLLNQEGIAPTSVETVLRLVQTVIVTLPKRW